MLSLNNNIRKSVLLLALMPAFFACSKSKFSATQAPPAQPVEETRNTRTDEDRTHRPRDPKPDYSDCRQRGDCQPQPQNECQDYEYEYSNKGPKTVHVWVAMDGSKSNVEERYRQLAGLVEMYENTIAREIPIHLGVITGHSPESYDSAISGNLFFRYSKADKDILRFDHTKKTRDANLKRLKNKILHMETDNSRGISDGGELLTVNMLAVLRNDNHRRLMKMQDGDILNLHFLGDENDICTIGQVPDGNRPNPRDRKSTDVGTSSEEVSRHRHCLQDIPGYSFNMNVTDNGYGYSQTLADEIIKASQRYRVHTSAFVYTGETPVPANGENEIGRGIVDLLGALKQNNISSRVFDLATLSTLVRSEADANAAVYAAGAEMMEGMNNDIYQRVQMKDQNGNPMQVRQEYIQEVSVDGRRVDYRVEKDGHIKLVRGCPYEGKTVKVRYCNRKQNRK
ncbi:hypothetical protein K2X05_13325 [bacterium]|nr:hypothetical protein [bacterium]